MKVYILIKRPCDRDDNGEDIVDVFSNAEKAQSLSTKLNDEEDAGDQLYWYMAEEFEVKD